jgi:hypothetical protein
MDGRRVALDQRGERDVIALAGPRDQGGVVHARYRHPRRAGGWNSQLCPRFEKFEKVSGGLRCAPAVNS